jgi:hypothetical protein
MDFGLFHETKGTLETLDTCQSKTHLEQLPDTLAETPDQGRPCK